MALPQIDAPVYRMNLPSTGEEIKYRPFLVKEEKILLSAFEEDNENEMMNAVFQILDNCTFGELDVHSMPIMDVEELFLNLRIRSKGETAQTVYICQNDVSEDGEEYKPCGHRNEVNINLEDHYIERFESHKQVFDLTNDGIGVKMTYPNLELLERIANSEDNPDQLMETIADSIEMIYNGETVHKIKDVPKQETIDFLDQLMDDQFNKIKNFFDTIPRVRIDHEFECESCGYTETLNLKGLASFFG